MTDFKGFNPDKNLGANFNTKQNGKSRKPDQPAKQADTAPTSDPYADLKMDPSRMLDLLTTQAKLNSPVNFENTGIERAMNTFSSSVTPERHAKVSQMMTQAYTDEFGSKPSQQILQDLVDNYLIGGVAIQNLK